MIARPFGAALKKVAGAERRRYGQVDLLKALFERRRRCGGRSRRSQPGIRVLLEIGEVGPRLDGRAAANPLRGEVTAERVVTDVVRLRAELADRTAAGGVTVAGRDPFQKERVTDPVLQFAKAVVAPVRRASRVVRRRREIEAVVLMAFEGEEAEGPAAAESAVDPCAERAEIAARQRDRGVERGRGLTGDEIDDPADGFGPIQSGGRTLDDLDAVESSRRLPIQVQQTAAFDAARSHDRLTVEQHEDLSRIDPLDLLAGGTRGFRPPARHDTGHLTQDLSDRFVAARFIDPASRDDVHEI